MNSEDRSEEKFVVRLKSGQRDKLKDRAKAEHQTMNGLLCVALDRYLEQSEAFDKLLDLVDKATNPKAGAFVTIKREHLRTLVLESNLEMSANEPAMVAALATLQPTEPTP